VKDFHHYQAALEQHVAHHGAGAVEPDLHDAEPPRRFRDKAGGPAGRRQRRHFEKSDLLSNFVHCALQ
jgi:uncharacterized protein involved in type VI secretion and phage assembly